MSTLEDQLNKVRTADGFIAALDQSGGSTPKALRLYGVGEDAYSNDEEMFSVVHEMRTRIVKSPAFNGDRILGAILFENTLDREIDGKNSASFLWEEKNVVPFLKVDKGLADEADGVQLMKPMPEPGRACSERPRQQPVFGTKMRSVIKSANPAGMAATSSSSSRSASRSSRRPDADHRARGRHQRAGQGRGRGAAAETQLLAHLDKLEATSSVMFKLTLPEEANFYRACQEHPNMVRVVALSGGYSREEANRRLSQNNGMIASFSRALTEGLSAQQSDDEFNAMLDAAIQSIFDASRT